MLAVAGVRVYPFSTVVADLLLRSSREFRAEVAFPAPTHRIHMRGSATALDSPTGLRASRLILGVPQGTLRYVATLRRGVAALRQRCGVLTAINRAIPTSGKLFSSDERAA